MNNTTIIPTNQEFVYVENVYDKITNRNEIELLDLSITGYKGEFYQSMFLFNEDLTRYVKETNSTSSFTGSLSARSIFIDFDNEWDLNAVKKEVIKFCIKLFDSYNLSSEQIQIYFSGFKGFHIEIPFELITSELVPTPKLAKRVETFVRRITEGFEYLDYKIYQHNRLKRHVNSLNPKSNLYKITISFQQLLSLDVESIKELASQPNSYINIISGLKTNEVLNKIYNEVIEDERITEIFKSVKENNIESDFDSTDDDALLNASNLLKGKINNYHDWIKVGLSLASIGEQGREPFLIVSDNPNYPNDTETFLNKKFDQLLNAFNNAKQNSVSIKTFYYFASKEGFKEEKFYGYYDLDNANRLVFQYHSELKFDHDSGKWFIWNGKFWELDTTKKYFDYGRKIIQIMSREANSIKDDKKRKKINEAVNRTKNKNRFTSMFEMASTDKQIRINASKFDSNDNLFNCQNGTIELTDDIKFYEHNVEDLISLCSNAEYHKDSNCPNFINFMNEIFQNNEEMIKYIQRAMGYTMTGYTSEDVVFFAYGGGANGKTTFFDIMKELFSTYYIKSRIDAIMIDKNERTGNDIARLKGKRLVSTSEVENGSRINESLIKDLTGGDTISARFLFKEYFDFEPKFKLWMYGNHKPILSGIDDGIRRRFHIIPFEYSIPENKRIQRHELINTFKSELSGILNWVLEGYLAWCEDGLNPPEKIVETT